MSAANYDLVIEQGKTFTRVLRWEIAPVVYKAITAITKGAPTQITSTAHGLPNNWRAAIVSVQGMTQINALGVPPRLSDYHRMSVVDANTLLVNDINSAEYSTYASGGFLQYNTPAPLAGYIARMSIKDRVGGTELLRLDTTNGRIALDAVNFTITLTVDAATTAALAWVQGVYDLEMESAGGVVTAIVQGNVTVTPEVTTL